MNRILTSATALLSLLQTLSCHSQRPLLTLRVHNPLDEDRYNEMAEIDVRKVDKLRHFPFRLLNDAGDEVPTQMTSDGMLIFPVSVVAHGVKTFKAVAGQAAQVDTLVRGRQFKERDDDFAWENDRMAYRAYGPALQARGERGFGYDIFTKSVEHPVLETFYAKACNPESLSKVQALRRKGLRRQADSLEHAISYHVDHGEGMDVFSVGPTLGAATSALLDEKGKIVYPWCYVHYEVMDRGPLRFMFRLTFGGQRVDHDEKVVETRTISLDRGSFLNRTSVHYDGLNSEHPLVAGIPLREQHPDGFAMDSTDGFVAYADSTDNARAGNGVIFVGALSRNFQTTKVERFTAAERREHGHALGHVMGIGAYHPGENFTYYWGSGWSKGFMPDMETWTAYLRHFSRCIRHPLEVTVK